MRLMHSVGRFGALFSVYLLLSCGADNTTPADQTSQPSVTGNDPLCATPGTDINWPALASSRCQRLSDYRLFTGMPDNPENLDESSDGIHYQLNSELFSDHARKQRYLFIPDNQKAVFDANEVFQFPQGTVLVKVFSLPTVSTAHPDSEIMEVRLLIHRAHGWVFIPYVWNPSIQDAELAIAGSRQPVSFSHQYQSQQYQSTQYQLQQNQSLQALAQQPQAQEQQLNFNYESPSQLACESCHRKDTDTGVVFSPIGPKARHLNRNIIIDGQAVNQLEYWQQRGIISLPDRPLPFAPDWRDTTYPLQQRAKAYLDINCAHCHSDQGAAALSGLRLEYGREVGYLHGVCNSAHGWRGGGYDIWPGLGSESSIPLRMELNEAKDRMPPIGRQVSDDEAVDLIREWIDSLPYQECAAVSN